MQPIGQAGASPRPGLAMQLTNIFSIAEGYDDDRRSRPKCREPE